MIVRLMSGQLFLSKASIWVVPQNISFVPFYFGMGLFIFFIKKGGEKNEKTDKAMATLTTLMTKQRFLIIIQYILTRSFLEELTYDT